MSAPSARTPSARFLADDKIVVSRGERGVVAWLGERGLEPLDAADKVTFLNTQTSAIAAAQVKFV